MAGQRICQSQLSDLFTQLVSQPVNSALQIRHCWDDTFFYLCTLLDLHIAQRYCRQAKVRGQRYLCWYYRMLVSFVHPKECWSLVSTLQDAGVVCPHYIMLEPSSVTKTWANFLVFSSLVIFVYRIHAYDIFIPEAGPWACSLNQPFNALLTNAYKLLSKDLTSLVCRWLLGHWSCFRKLLEGSKNSDLYGRGAAYL